MRLYRSGMLGTFARAQARRCARRKFKNDALSSPCKASGSCRSICVRRLRPGRDRNHHAAGGLCAAVRATRRDRRAGESQFRQPLQRISRRRCSAIWVRGHEEDRAPSDAPGRSRGHREQLARRDRLLQRRQDERIWRRALLWRTARLRIRVRTARRVRTVLGDGARVRARRPDVPARVRTQLHRALELDRGEHAARRRPAGRGGCAGRSALGVRRPAAHALGHAQSQSRRAFQRTVPVPARFSDDRRPPRCSAGFVEVLRSQT